MCCLFGLIDYKNSLSLKQKNRILSVLSAACEARGTDATGIAYNTAARLSIYKRPVPAHLLRIHLTSNASVVMGHTRMTTQGNERRNYNNHPFFGDTGGTVFALAHNGMLQNDHTLRRKLQLPATRIETDSYIAVQLIEQKKELSFAALRYMAEQLEGSFTFTLLDRNDSLYFVKGDNPMCLYHYPRLGLYLYASTEEILAAALGKLPYSFGKANRVGLTCGELLRIDASGEQTRAEFDTKKLSSPWYRYSFWPDDGAFSCMGTSCKSTYDREYLQELKSIAATLGCSPTHVDALLADGFTTTDIEEMIYYGNL